ncbi:hypothetical protein PR001_g16176 [Phytophthora rubi]|uniref:Uncharacterized protein n=1 Tax=Phytophthora rubi TaxID=129364 RepID=A0A6A3KY56_9STRA|nr:hypothetical protein PR001_g16176 [Phytophthora rubi]
MSVRVLLLFVLGLRHGISYPADYVQPVFNKRGQLLPQGGWTHVGDLGGKGFPSLSPTYDRSPDAAS